MGLSKNGVTPKMVVSLLIRFFGGERYHHLWTTPCVHMISSLPTLGPSLSIADAARLGFLYNGEDWNGNPPLWKRGDILSAKNVDVILLSGHSFQNWRFLSAGPPVARTLWAWDGSQALEPTISWARRTSNVASGCGLVWWMVVPNDSQMVCKLIYCT